MLLKKISEFYFYKQLVMSVEMKDELTAFVDALDECDQKPAVKCEDPKTGSQWPVVEKDSVGGWPTVDVHGESSWSEPDRTSDNWADITNVFDNWLICLIDTERRICTPGKSLKSDRINQSIDGMLHDGLINFSDAGELRYIGNLWIRLLNSYTLYRAGCPSYRYDIISIVFDLYASKQIGKELCIQICTEL